MEAEKPFFHFRALYWTQTEEQKTGRAGNGASTNLRLWGRWGVVTPTSLAGQTLTQGESLVIFPSSSHF